MSSYGLEIIERDECESLLDSQQVGRVGVCGGRPGVFPVLYARLDGDIVFRTAPGEKLIAAALNRDVVFEIDSYDVATRTGWSVNVVGSAEEIDDPAERERAEALESAAVGRRGSRSLRARFGHARSTGRRIRSV